MFDNVIKLEFRTCRNLETIIKLTLVTLTLINNVISGGVNSNLTMKQIKTRLEDEEIYPRIVQEFPTHILEISYPDKDIRFGEMLENASIAREQPIKVSWPTEKNQMYVILMTDPDGPTWSKPNQQEWHHWLVTNIYDNNIEDGEVLSEYIGPRPGAGSRIHRYVFMAFKQPPTGDVAYNELNLDTRPVNRLRGYFSTRRFADKYNLTLKAINYYEVDWTIKATPRPKRKKYSRRGRKGPKKRGQKQEEKEEEEEDEEEDELAEETEKKDEKGEKKEPGDEQMFTMIPYV